MQAIFYYAVFYPVIELLAALAIALILIYGGAQVLGGRPDARRAGRLHPVLGALLAADLGPVREVQRAAGRDGGLRAHLRPARHRARGGEPGRRRCGPPPWKAASASRACRSRTPSGATRSCREIDFAVEPGRSVALVGATGAGKTSIISLLMRFYDVRRGRVSLDGRDVREWDLRAPALVDGARAAGRAPLQRHDRVEHPARLGDRRSSACAPPPRPCRPTASSSGCPKGYDTEVTERGVDAVGGPEAAAVLRARAGPRPARADPGRGHLLGRHRDGAADPGGAQRADARPHLDRDRAPALDGAERRPDPGAAQGPDPRARHAPGAARPARHVLQALPAPVQGPGAGAGAARGGQA